MNTADLHEIEAPEAPAPIAVEAMADFFAVMEMAREMDRAAGIWGGDNV